MTATEYGVKVTEIIDNATGHNFEYPESFEAEVTGFFRDRLPAQIAAESVMAGVFSKEDPKQTAYVHPACPALRAVVEQAMSEILHDIETGRVPASVSTYSELHDYVDANEYGGACEEDPDVPFTGFTVEQMDFWNAMQNAVHQWLQAGRPKVIA